MTTVGDLIANTQRHLYGVHKEILNVLDASITTTQTSLVLSDTFTTIGSGTIISIDDELIYVRNSTPASKALSPLIRGFRGTTKAAHTEGALVEIAPRFPQVYIRQLLLEEIRSWPADLFRVASLDLSFSSSTTGYDLTGFDSGVDDFDFALQLSFSPDTYSRDTTNRALGPTGWDIDFDAPSASFPSGRALLLGRGYDRTARLTVGQRFDLTSFDDDAELEDEVGLAASMVDIPPYGAAWRALSARETQRTSTESQGEPRKSEEVPPMYRSQAAANMKRIRDGRISDEAIRLRHKYPIRIMGL